MLTTFLEVLPITLLTAMGGWFGKAYMERMKLKSAEAKVASETSVTLEQHRDGLTFQLLDAARSELHQLREEVDKLRPMESHLYHLQQALEHIDALLCTDPELKKAAERNARAFLNRMRRLDEARGTIANEVQRADSAVNLAHPEKED